MGGAGGAGNNALRATLYAGGDVLCTTPFAGGAGGVGDDALCATTFAGGVGDDALCATLYAEGAGVMRCVLL